jgi:hypothetical protein
MWNIKELSNKVAILHLDEISAYTLFHATIV